MDGTSRDEVSVDSQFILGVNPPKSIYTHIVLMDNIEYVSSEQVQLVDLGNVLGSLFEAL
jgi:hypothetical protein